MKHIFERINAEYGYGQHLKAGGKISITDIAGPATAFLLSGTDEPHQRFYEEVIQVEGDNVTVQFDGQDSPETISTLMESKMTDGEYQKVLERREKWMEKLSTYVVKKESIEKLKGDMA
jgi:hypothetical protein